jgi:MFS family permease
VLKVGELAPQINEVSTFVGMADAISPVAEEELPMADYENWRPWPIWSAVWIGALAAIAVGLIIGLIGFAVGAHELTAPRFTPWKNVRIITTIFNIGGSFFAFVVGGWVAARIAGLRNSEPAMLHGGVVWLLTIPMLLVLAALGATGHWGGWYGGLAGSPAWATAVPAIDPEAARAFRNTALVTVTALLLGLVGAVLGGWLASGEPMSLTYYRRRTLDPLERPRRVA